MDLREVEDSFRSENLNRVHILCGSALLARNALLPLPLRLRLLWPLERLHLLMPQPHLLLGGLGDGDLDLAQGQGKLHDPWGPSCAFYTYIHSIMRQSLFWEYTK